MKLPVKILLGLGLTAAALLTATQASAQHFRGPRVGVYIGVPLGGPWYYAPPYYAYPAYPPAVYVQPPAPTVYIERADGGAAAASGNAQPAAQAAAPAADWYYCTDSKAYYPYVKECASAWLRVPSRPAATPQ